MYCSYFGLNENPFSITPDPRYLFMSERHGEALAHLVYGVTESGGFVQLTGEVGTGKTMLVRTLLQSRLPANADVAVVLNPQLTSIEFLQTICEELHVTLPADKDSGKSLIDALNRHLLDAHARGRRVILVVDEAQNLSPGVLEQVRLLTNLETARQKLLQIILIGQPELRDLLARNDLRQLAQRITGRYHLEPLTRDDTERYIEHRLKVAGALGSVFDPGAKQAIYRLSQGVPRLINVICDRALLGAYSSETRHVDRRLVRRAAAEVAGRAYASPWLNWMLATLGAAAVVVLAAGAWFVVQAHTPLEPASISPPSAAGASTPAAPPAANEVPQQLQDAPDATAGTNAAALSADTEDPPAETEHELDEQLQLASGLTGEEAALADLFKLWGVSYAANASPGCKQAQALGLNCLKQRGSWNALLQFDRPALLKLIDSRGAIHFVLLKSVQADQAKLSVAGIDVSHAVADVQHLWFGNSLLLWKPPNGSDVALSRGVNNENVAWLRRSLAAIDARYRAEPLDSEQFDANLEQRVRDFQRDYRLDVDGYAGEQTQAIIDSLRTTGDTPHLKSPGGANNPVQAAQQ